MNKVVQESLGMLGRRATDKVTGFTGVITSMSFDLYGCVQAIIQPAVEKESAKIESSRYFDVARLEVSSDEPVMAVPAFAKADKGPAGKPPASSR